MKKRAETSDSGRGYKRDPLAGPDSKFRTNLVITNRLYDDLEKMAQADSRSWNAMVIHLLEQAVVRDKTKVK